VLLADFENVTLSEALAKSIKCFFRYLFDHLTPLLLQFDMTTQTQVPATGFAIPKFAQDIVAGTVGGWAQVVVGKAC
jgi:hypothetical protein